MAGRLGRLARHLLPAEVAGGPPAGLHAGCTAVVTGAAGYVGGWLCHYLLHRGYTVRACVRDAGNDRKAGFLKRMQSQHRGRLTLHSADMTVPGAYDEIFRGAHTVFHPAEVMMSFGPGRDMKLAVRDLGRELKQGALAGAALDSSRHVVDSINRSGSVATLVYTSSIMAMMDGDPAFYERNPIIDEERHPSEGPSGTSPNGGYNALKDATERFFFEQAALGGWRCVSANPGDVIGPILSPHQAWETWQGKIAGIVQGDDPPEETSTTSLRRPWITVDVRDVAEAQILLAESSVPSGSRFLLTDMTRIHPEDIGRRINDLFPSLDAATGVRPASKQAALARVLPVWDRVQARNDRVRQAIGFEFRRWDDTLAATVSSLLEVGGVSPRRR